LNIDQQSRRQSFIHRNRRSCIDTTIIHHLLHHPPAILHKG